MTAPTAVPVLVGVGFPLGAQWWDDEVSRPGFAVRLGGDLLTLTADEYDLWWQARFHATSADLLAWAAKDGLDAAATIFGALRDAGLLAEVTPAGAEAFARRHRLLPAGIGGGMVVGDAEAGCQVWSGAAEPLLDLDWPTYQCWAFSDGARPIDDVVALVHPATGLSREVLLHRVILALPALTELGAARLDRLPA